MFGWLDFVCHVWHTLFSGTWQMILGDLEVSFHRKHRVWFDRLVGCEYLITIPSSYNDFPRKQISLHLGVWITHRNVWKLCLKLTNKFCSYDHQQSWRVDILRWYWYQDLINIISKWSVWYKTKFDSQNFGYQIWFCTRQMIVLMIVLVESSMLSELK